MATNNSFRTAILTLMFSALSMCSYSQIKSTKEMSKNNNDTLKNHNVQMSCKLTTPELQKRKETVIASLKQQIIEKKELQDGYAFKFAGKDSVLDELTEFVKTERTCCDFFTFRISVSGDKSEAWLELTGGNRAKDFIISELGL
ncbi:hypothetical protein [Chryseobacterium koreense]